MLTLRLIRVTKEVHTCTLIWYVYVHPYPTCLFPLSRDCITYITQERLYCIHISTRDLDNKKTQMIYRPAKSRNKTMQKVF